MRTSHAQYQWLAFVLRTASRPLQVGERLDSYDDAHVREQLKLHKTAG